MTSHIARFAQHCQRARNTAIVIAQLQLPWRRSTTKAFSSLLIVWDRGHLADIPEAFITDHIIISLCQVLLRTLMAQNASGSWGRSYSQEMSAYATLTISKASILQFLASIGTQISSAIAITQAFLHSTKDIELGHFQIQNVCHGSIILAERCVLAAQNAAQKSQSSLSSNANSLVTVRSTNVQQLARRCFHSPPVGLENSWKLHGAFMEGLLFLPYLKRIISEHSPRKMDNRILEVISFVWVVCNYVEAPALSTSRLRGKMGTTVLEEIDKDRLEIALSNDPSHNGPEHSDGFANVRAQSNGSERATNPSSDPEEPPPSTHRNNEHEQKTPSDVEQRATKACRGALGALRSNHKAFEAHKRERALEADPSSSKSVLYLPK